MVSVRDILRNIILFLVFFPGTFPLFLLIIGGTILVLIDPSGQTLNMVNHQISYFRTQGYDSLGFAILFGALLAVGVYKIIELRFRKSEELPSSE